MFRYLTAALLAMFILGCSSEPEQVWIAGWKKTSEMNIQRAGSATVVHDGFIYMIGGVDGRNFLRSTEYSKIQPDGSLGPWTYGPLLQEERGFTEAVVHDGYIYVVGGGNGPNGQHLLRTVERAKINADGSLGAWESEPNQTVLPRRCTKLTLIGDRIYSYGGFGGTLLDSVEFSRLDQDGHVSPWQMASESMLLPRYVNSVKVVDGVAYVLGGHDQNRGVGITDVEWTRPDAQGDMKGWQRTSPMQIGRYGQASAAKHGKIYILGGLTGLEYLASVEMADVLPSGGLGKWRMTTPLDQPRASFSAVSTKDHIYVLGGTNRDGYLRSVEYTTIGDSGDLGFMGTASEKVAHEAHVAEQKAASGPALPNEGVVLQTLDTEMYSYVQVRSANGVVWLAGPKTKLPLNSRIRYSKGVYMSNFYSKELQRGFPAVTFVSRIEPVK